ALLPAAVAAQHVHSHGSQPPSTCRVTFHPGGHPMSTIPTDADRRTARAGAGWNAAVGAVVNPSRRRGGTLRLASSADVDSLDPARTYYVWVWLLQRLLNRTLMAYPTEAGPKGLTPVPDLAEAPGEVSADGLTWTYRL